MDKWTIGYFWLLSLMGAAFYGHEWGLMKSDYLITAADNKLQNCQAIISGVQR